MTESIFRVSSEREESCCLFSWRSQEERRTISLIQHSSKPKLPPESDQGTGDPHGPLFQSSGPCRSLSCCAGFDASSTRAHFGPTLACSATNDHVVKIAAGNAELLQML